MSGAVPRGIREDSCFGWSRGTYLRANFPAGMRASASRFRPGTLLHSSRRRTSEVLAAFASTLVVISHRYPFFSLVGSHCASVKWLRVEKETFAGVSA